MLNDANWTSSRKIKHDYVCRSCGKVYLRSYYTDNKEEIKITNSEYYKEHIEKGRADRKVYRAANREQLNSQTKIWRESHREEIKTYYWTLRELALKIVFEANGGTGDIRCMMDDCGCDALHLLELDYKNGGHTKLTKEGKLPRGSQLYREIKDGKVEPSLFRVLCKPHNWLTFIEKKFSVDFALKFIGFVTPP